MQPTASPSRKKSRDGTAWANCLTAPQSRGAGLTKLRHRGRGRQPARGQRVPWINSRRDWRASTPSPICGTPMNEFRGDLPSGVGTIPRLFQTLRHNLLTPHELRAQRKPLRRSFVTITGIVNRKRPTITREGPLTMLDHTRIGTKLFPGQRAANPDH